MTNEQWLVYLWSIYPDGLFIQIWVMLLIIFIILNINASELVESSNCKGCHPTIYSEFYNSSHRKSSIFENKVHKAMWDLHPDKKTEKQPFNPMTKHIHSLYCGFM